jgi:hypothetical protein
MTSDSDFEAMYDGFSDVLFLSVGRQSAASTTEDSRGILWRYNAANAIIGATVVDFAGLWSRQRARLTSYLALHLPLSQTAVELAIEGALGAPISEMASGWRQYDRAAHR